MSFIVEDGTGVPDSISYVSVAEAESILLDLGYDDFPSETELVKASLYVDMSLDPASFILTEDQGLLWPRKPFTDNQGRNVEGVPFALKRAVSVIAASFMEEDLFDVEPSVTSESYGNSSVQFSGPASQVPTSVTKQLSFLKSLGYGSSKVYSVRIIRS